MKILFTTNFPSPYRVDFFNELGKKCDLTVAYERNKALHRDSKWINNSERNFTEAFLNQKPIRTSQSIGLGIIKTIRENNFDAIVLCGYASPSVMLAITYCRIHHIPYIIESDGGFFQIDRGLKKVLKKFLLCGAQFHFTTCEEHIRYLVSLGFPREKIYKYPFTSLHESDIAKAPATDEEKKALRAELGIKEDKVVLSVGQFIPRKGFDVLLNAAVGFPNGTGTYIIGGKPTDGYIELKERLGLINVHFEDFKDKNELKKWYRAADVFVLPTREDIWGLVINEAMAQGLPVITTDRCIAGLELVDNKNGMIVSVDSVTNITETINEIYCDLPLMLVMSDKSIAKIREYSIENMAEFHYSVLSNYSDYSKECKFGKSRI